MDSLLPDLELGLLPRPSQLLQGLRTLNVAWTSETLAVENTGHAGEAQVNLGCLETKALPDFH